MLKMTVDGDQKLYNHFKELIDGKVKTGNSVRDQLIISDAKKNLADLIKKRPGVKFVDTPVVKEEEEVKEKGKK